MSKTVESLISKYLENRICQLSKYESVTVYNVCFSIEAKLWNQFRQIVPKGKTSKTLQFLIKQYVDGLQ